VRNIPSVFQPEEREAELKARSLACWRPPSGDAEEDETSAGQARRRDAGLGRPQAEAGWRRSAAMAALEADASWRREEERRIEAEK